MRLPRNGSGQPISVLVADSNMMSCKLLAAGLRCRAQFKIVASVVDMPSLIRTARETQPNVALINVALADGPLAGLAAVREIQRVQTATRVVLLKDHSDSHHVVEAFRSGARGVFCRSESDLDDLCKCIHRVHGGQIWASTPQLDNILEALTQISPLRVVGADGSALLSKREEDVARLVAEGLGNREIAAQLNLSEHTVKNYLFHIFDKLGISTRVELVLYALANPRKTSLPPDNPEEPSMAPSSGVSSSDAKLVSRQPSGRTRR